MDESMKLEKVIDKEFENSERERSFKMEKNTPDMSLINVFLYREVDRLESEFDESYHEMQEELSKDKILDYIDIIRIGKGNFEWKKLF